MPLMKPSAQTGRSSEFDFGRGCAGVRSIGVVLIYRAKSRKHTLIAIVVAVMILVARHCGVPANGVVDLLSVNYDGMIWKLGAPRSSSPPVFQVVRRRTRIDQIDRH